jgi:hypothetical protein
VLTITRNIDNCIRTNINPIKDLDRESIYVQIYIYIYSRLYIYIYVCIYACVTNLSSVETLNLHHMGVASIQ